MKHRVLIVDDQSMQRRALESFVQESGQFVVAESLGSADLAVAYCRKFPVDMILMDIVMTNGMSGIEAAAQIRKEHPAVKIILVTSMPEADYLRRAQEAGADGLWYKEAAQEPLISLMKRTLTGGQGFPDRPPCLSLGLAKSDELTEGEIRVLRGLVRGQTDQEIADEIHLSVWTVRSHIQGMLQKTGYRNRVELAVKARASGFIIDE